MTTETTPNTSTAPGPALPVSRSSMKPANGKRKRALLILMAVVVLAGIGWLAYYFLVGRWHEDTDDAYVQGNVVTVTPQTGGTVVDIHADDGMRVEAGQTLVSFDPSDARGGLCTSGRQPGGYGAPGARHLSRGGCRPGRYRGARSRACRRPRQTWTGERTGCQRRGVRRRTGACEIATGRGAGSALGRARADVAQPRAGRQQRAGQQPASPGSRRTIARSPAWQGSATRSSPRPRATSRSAMCSLASACSRAPR